MCIVSSEPRSRRSAHRHGRDADRTWDDPPHRRSYYGASDTRVATLPEASFRRRSRSSREYDGVVVRDPPARHYGNEVVLLEPRRSTERAVYPVGAPNVSRYEYRSESLRRG